LKGENHQKERKNSNKFSKVEIIDRNKKTESLYIEYVVANRGRKKSRRTVPSGGHQTSS